jgi:hypothetical protein
MTRQEKTRRCERRGKNKSSYTEENKPVLLKTQSPSPWANPPAYDPLADIQSDKNDWFLTALAELDADFFNENPDRSFHLRNATPCERDGTGYDWVMVARWATGFVRLPQRQPPALAGHDASEYDTEKKARALFNRMMNVSTLENTDPVIFSLIEEVREQRKALSLPRVAI